MSQRALKDLSSHELRDLKAAASEAISALGWLDLQVVEVKGLRQAEHEWSVAAEVLRKIQAEEKRRARRRLDA